VTQVTIQNRDSFFCESMEIRLDDIGRVPVDIAYGGNYFALVNANHLNLPVIPAHIDSLKKLGLAIRTAVNRQFSFSHPVTGLPATVDLTEIYENTDPPRNIVVFGAGQVDRSPCGTGTSAKMAFLHHKGRLRPGEPYAYQSVFGTEFTGEIVKETTVGDRPAIVPEITGKAWITGFHQFVVDDTDPYRYGFAIDVGR
jgi:proline racemase/trans-L-3-hydroxyproline dehydratase